ncbi:SMP-30/gluconolactonase/LRE family protein [Streptomyces griseoaurantiacus]|uniref:superoxide dismutase n=1 Tax=Streptomyces griseoaurantiacus TaxID=68213 RepID=UPI00362D3BCD
MFTDRITESAAPEGAAPEGDFTRPVPRRRRGRAVAVTLAALLGAGLPAVPAAAAPAFGATAAPAADRVSPAAHTPRPKPYPTVLGLPNGFSPEGIALAGGAAYTGSLVDGSIQRVDLRTGVARQFAPSPGPGRIAVGMDTDRFGRLWVAGGGAGFWPGVRTTYRVYDTRTGAKLVDVEPAGAVYLNDVIVTRDAAWFTDTFSSVLVRVPIGDDGSIGRPRTVALGGEWTAGEGLNGNGIAATPDGRSLIVGHTSGALYLVPAGAHDRARARRISLSGDEAALAAGADGLVLDGRTLYVVGPTGVVDIRLSPSLTAGRVLGVTEVPGAAWPTTAAAFGDRLYVVDANFGEDLVNVGNPDATFRIVAVPRP